ncbi:murein biosynthesis integral membrane protein MurJ [Embleya sp. NPDC050493]|uniref:murein biosynthesis integral membrane protein MurJ n=1 Tax=Embleya sp. NPDC050493 TaxID=3363989 RepID=UPI003789228F
MAEWQRGGGDPSAETLPLHVIADGPASRPPTIGGPADPPARPGGRHRRPPAADADTASTGPDTAGGVARAGLVMAAGTVLSRATGMLRTILIVAALGTAGAADAYNVANTIPNMLFTLLAGGALNAVFVPRMIRAMRDEREGEAYANRLLTLTVLVLGVLTVLAWLAAPQLIRLTGGQLGAGDAGGGHASAVTFARYCLPQIFFYGVFTVVGQILNARGRFGSMMWTPVLNNVVVIATFALFIVFTHDAGPQGLSAAQTRLLGLGTTLGIVVQAACLFPYLRASGLRIRPRFDWRGSGLRQDARLARWTLLFALVNQIGYTVVVNLTVAAGAAAERAGAAGGAGYTPYGNAQTLWILPQSVVTVSLTTALFPRMCRAVAEHRPQELREHLSRSLRLSGVAIVPAAFALLCFGPQLTELMFRHGETGSADVTVMARVLAGFSLGLIPFSAQYVLLRGFYAMEDTRTPFLAAVWIAVVNAGLSGAAYLLLPARWAVVGMALAYTLAYTVGLAVTALRLRRRLSGATGRITAGTYGRLIAAGAAAGGAGLAATRPLTGLGEGAGLAALQLGLGGVVMVVAFVALGRLLRIHEVTAAMGTLRTRFAG